jgi:hypothetical protein
LLTCVILLPGPAAADEIPPTISVNDASAPEGSAVPFVISLSGPTTVAVTVTAKTSGGTGYTARDETVTIAAGDTTANFPVATQGNELDESDRQFQVTLSGPSGATAGDMSGTGTITDDDATPTLAITGPATVDEVNANARYTIAITGQSASKITVNFATANGSATAGADFTQMSGSRSWASGETATKSFTVPILVDTLDEFAEDFSVTLSGASNAAINTATVTTTITDNDDQPSIASIGDVTVAEGNTGTVDAAVNVTLSAASGKKVTVPYSTAPATAKDPADFEAKSGDLVFEPGDTTKAIVVKVKGDTLFEQPNETFSVVLFDPTNATKGADNIGEITITDDDAAPSPTVTNASVAEGNSATTDLKFKVSLPAPRPAATFSYRTATGTANGSDYIEVGGAPLVFPASTGSTPTELEVTIKIKGDGLDELDESFTLELVNPTSGAVVATAIGTITNDDNNTEILIADASADEPSTGTSTLKFTIRLSAVSGRPVSVGWQTANGTATAGVDYNAASGTVPFAPGETTKTIEVTVIGDTVNEDNETVLVRLTGSGATLIDNQAQGTIVDKNAPPSLAIDDLLTREGEVATFTITLSGKTVRTVTVVARTIDGTAKEGSDYNARRVVLSFLPGETTKTFVVVGIDDAVQETLETYFVGLEDATNAIVTKARGTATIDMSDQVAAPPTTDPKAPTGKVATVLTPRMVLGPRVVMVGPNGIAKMLVTCQKASPIACAGTIELERATKPLLKLGKRTFTVKKGAKAYASIKLSVQALTILRKNGTLRAKVTVVVKTSTKTVKVSPGIVTLQRVKTTSKPKPPQVVVDP